MAQTYFPLPKEEILKFGTYSDYQKPQIDNSDPNLVNSKDLPLDIKLANEDILSKIIRCELSGKDFKITKMEFDFYKQLNLPIPRLHPQIRLQNRIAQRNPRYFFITDCASCRSSIYTTQFNPESKKILCESCYSNAVI
jgi:hypothetical protein